MADGTRLKSLDERLGLLEGRLTEMATDFGKEKTERSKRLGEMSKQIEGLGTQMIHLDENFDEMKLLMLSLHRREETLNAKSTGESST